ncbi:unnamed protein product [Pelagomonas calceolata]|uniref:Fatty acid desaturase domain-containing protein n=2 Tax=Pelagomonas calceolata TaxID=35677 RepID=A0A8J2SP37_9STRA|nr:unnamed protein product [Pelagomonas calceolata]
MVSRLLFILALLHAKTDAVLEIARPRQPQPKAIRIAPPDRPTTDSRGGAVAAWHAERKNAITKKLGAEVIAKLEAPTPGRTLGCLVAADALLIGLATYTPHLDGLWWLGFASTLGAYCSLAQFALLHDVVHGGADDLSQPIGERRERREQILKCGSQPSVFGYWLYLALGHLNHHAATGDYSAKELFASDQLAFEDGDLFFASHRQESTNGAADDGGGIIGDMTISISRFAYRYLWRFDQDDDIGLSRNALAYAWSMAFERFALCCNDKYVALSGSNAFFFPNKPQAFHDLCADYARFSALCQLAVFALSGFDGRSLLFLLVAETIWQVPPLPTAALFVSNHGVDDEGYGVGGAAPDRPTHSVYGGPWFDVLCVAANYHCEHHDFPKVPLWNLPELKRRAGAEFYPASPPWYDVLRGAFSSKITYPRWERV